jgi:hypothetical protein
LNDVIPDKAVEEDVPDYFEEKKCEIEESVDYHFLLVGVVLESPEGQDGPTAED